MEAASTARSSVQARPRQDHDSHRLARDTYDVFVKPFTSAQRGRYLSLQNICNTHPACMYDAAGRPSGAFNVEGIPEAGVLAGVQRKATRMLAAAHGHTVAPLAAGPARPALADATNHTLRVLLQHGYISAVSVDIVQQMEADLANYAAYLLQTGLLTAADLDHLLLVPDVTDFHDILTRVASSGRIIVPYNPTPGFLDLCQASQDLCRLAVPLLRDVDFAK